LSGASLVLLLWFGLIPATGPSISVGDKIQHILGFATLGFCLARARPLRREASMAALVALALFIEGAQGAMGWGRTMSGLDAVASAFGGALGLVVGAQAGLTASLSGGLAIFALAITFQTGVHTFGPVNDQGQAIRPPGIGAGAPVAPGKLIANP
jgi:hypothetical protein